MAGKSKHSPEEFIRAWQTAKSRNDVATKLGVSTQAISIRASQFRKKGIPLKWFGRNETIANRIPELKALAESLVVISTGKNAPKRRRTM